MEALFIKELCPSLNIQAEDLQALPSMKRTYLHHGSDQTDDVTEPPANRRPPSANGV